MFYYFNAEMKYYEKPIPTLNDASWAEIQKAAQDGTASTYWNVGDRKEITLNGTCRARTFNNKKVYAYILGFNHNAELEGDNTITFQIGFDDLTDGVHIALTKNYNASNGTGFCMNATQTNVSGWKNSLMRKTIIPEFISCLSSDLQSVLKTVNKYTDNGNGDTHQSSADVLATQDEVFLLAEYEVFGARTYANEYEQNKQAQYDYYKNGNNKKMYDDQVMDTAIYWRGRSPYYNNAKNFCCVNQYGNADHLNALSSNGFAPAFVVG